MCVVTSNEAGICFFPGKGQIYIGISISITFDPKVRELPKCLQLTRERDRKLSSLSPFPLFLQIGHITHDTHNLRRMALSFIFSQANNITVRGQKEGFKARVQKVWSCRQNACQGGYFCGVGGERQANEPHGGRLREEGRHNVESRDCPASPQFNKQR